MTDHFAPFILAGIFSLSMQKARLRSDCAYVQSDLNLACSHMLMVPSHDDLHISIYEDIYFTEK